MDMTAYKGLLDIMLSGVESMMNLNVLIALLLCLVFAHTASAKGNESDDLFLNFVWVSLSSVFAFALTSVAVFVLSTPLAGLTPEAAVVGPLNLTETLTVVSVASFVLLAFWMFLPEKEVKKSAFEEDDLSTAPLMAIVFGIGLAGFVFANPAWPKELLEQAVSAEVLQQGAFYGFAYMLAMSLTWLAVIFGFYTLLGRFILGEIPKVVGSVLLVAAALFQVVQLLLV